MQSNFLKSLYPTMCKYFSRVKPDDLHIFKLTKTMGSMSFTTSSSRFDSPDVSVIKENDNQIAKTDPISMRPPLPIITSRELMFPPRYAEPRLAWVENLDTVEEEKLGTIELHPEIFAAFPRLDLIHRNMVWQTMYSKISWTKSKDRHEAKGSKRKPWPQKGTGRARHGDRKNCLWKGGGRAHGPRGPKTYFFMLPVPLRVRGLIATLSAKFAQDDIHIVDTLDIPSDDPKFLERLTEHRKWGVSVLFIDDSDIMSRNITIATDTLPSFNLMPVYGLNVFSMLKHETLVLSLAAVNRIEERLLFHLHKLDVGKPEGYREKLYEEQMIGY